ncbi:MAG: 50S ribosomal protein L3 [Pseudomonadota bacterium]
MTIGLVGKKVGMTRIFTDTGESIPVTIVLAEPNRISQLKNKDVDNYDAVQVTTGEKKRKRVSKPLSGHLAKANVEAGDIIVEFRLSDENKDQFKPGEEINVSLFESTEFVDVTGTTKGKGFAGVIKRHHFAAQNMTHGNSRAHRAPGSIGQRQSPGRVFKGKKMAGQLGNKQRTIQNLKLVKVDKEKNLLMIKGAVPGAPGTHVIVKPAIKKQAQSGDKHAG